MKALIRFMPIPSGFLWLLLLRLGALQVIQVVRGWESSEICTVSNDYSLYHLLGTVYIQHSQQNCEVVDICCYEYINFYRITDFIGDADATQRFYFCSYSQHLRLCPLLWPAFLDGLDFTLCHCLSYFTFMADILHKKSALCHKEQIIGCLIYLNFLTEHK